MENVVYNPIEKNTGVNNGMNIRTNVVNHPFQRTKKENFEVEGVNFDALVRVAL